MKIGLIYQYKNKINGKIYIGQTKLSLEKRHQRHIKSMKDENENTYFHRALRKYGIDNFELTVIEDEVPIELLDEKEIYYIKHFDSFYTSNKGYNMTKGGVNSYNGNQKIHGSIEVEIKRLLRETTLSFKEIASMLGLPNIYAISEINRGKIFREKDIKYPIRSTTKPTFITQEEFQQLVDKIQNTQDTWCEICTEFNTNITLLNKINKGKHRLCDKTLQYPLRKIEQDSTYMNKITQQDVVDIIKLLLFDNKSVKDIMEIYHLGKNTVGDISRGLTWKTITHQFQCPIIKNKLINKTIFEEIYGIV